jgi:threonine/homoserine/homoserine lactone efflux protein
MLPSEDLPGFVVAALALTGSPGPANLGLAAAGAAFGARRCVVLSAGIIVGVLAVLLVTATGLTGLVLAQPVLGPAVRLLAVGYMLYLAWAIATAPPLAVAGGSRRRPSFAAGLFLGIGNPKSYAAMAALFSGFLLGDGPLLDVTLKALILAVIIALVNLAWLLLGSALTRLFGDPRLNRVINVVFAVLLLASVAVAFWQ